jgi:ubiquitin-like 1-activating enzyme E1 A
MNTFISVTAAAAPPDLERPAPGLPAIAAVTPSQGPPSGRVLEVAGTSLPSVRVLILGGASAAAAVSANAACRAAGVAFFWARVWGTGGAFFADLGPSHVAASARRVEAAEPAPGQPAAAAPPPLPPRTLAYVELAASLGVPSETLPAHTAAAYWQLRAVAEAERGGIPLVNAADALAAAAPSAAAALGAAQLASLAATEMPPVAAIVGGVLANDVLKTISGVGEPAHNWFSFSSDTSLGSIDGIGL